MRDSILMFGNIGLKYGVLTEKLIQEALVIQKYLNKTGAESLLGKIFLQLDSLSKESIEGLLQFQRGSNKKPEHYPYGEIAKANRLISPFQLRECLDLQVSENQGRPLGYYLVAKGYLSPEDHSAVIKVINRLKESSTPSNKEDLRDKLSRHYGRVALKYGFVTTDQLDEYCKKRKALGEFFLPISEYFLEKNYLSLENHYFIQDVLKDQDNKTHRCSQPEPSRSPKKAEELRKETYLQWLNGQETKKKIYLTTYTLLPDDEWENRPKDFLENSDILPDYSIKKKLGQGGMAVVYKAYHKSSGREVALKILPPPGEIEEVYSSGSKDQNVLAERSFRFIHEASILNNMDHPNIVRISDVGSFQGYMYFAMECIEGETLSDIAVEFPDKLMAEQWALEIVRDVARALQVAWENQVVHRDIKLENIMITSDGQVKVFDFGIAKYLDFRMKEENITSRNIIMGTPIYMAPEQTMLLSGMEVDIRTDIYSLGICLYMMLTGEPPYDHASSFNILSMHCYNPIPRILKKRKGLSLETSKLIEKMLAKDPAERFPTPRDLEQAVEGVLKTL